MDVKQNAFLSSFNLYNQYNFDHHIPQSDNWISLPKDGDINFRLSFSVNFSHDMFHLLQDQNTTYYLYVSVFPASIKPSIYLSQQYAKVPTYGDVNFAFGFNDLPIEISNNLIKANNINSIDIQLALSQSTQEDLNFDSSILQNCFFETVFPLVEE